jgi:8-oxo-dGTP diphosphatase
MTDDVFKNQYPKVGVGVMVIKDGKVLLGKRKDSHGVGEYAWPGGHLEYMESFEECAKREVLEETGMQIKNIRFARLLNLKAYSPKHYVDIGLIADWDSGEPQLLEPDKMESWSWYDIDKLPRPLFGPELSTIEAYKTGRNYFDN